MPARIDQSQRRFYRETRLSYRSGCAMAILPVHLCEARSLRSPLAVEKRQSCHRAGWWLSAGMALSPISGDAMSRGAVDLKDVTVSFGGP